MRLKPIGPEVLAHFSYDPASPSGLNHSGTVLHNGYRQVVFNKQFYKAHRVVWALHYGDPGGALIDHIDGNKANNRIENLRKADHAEQQRNRTVQANSMAGVKGLHFDERRSRWVGQVHAGKQYLRTSSKDKLLVEQWLRETRARYHKEFAKD